MRIRTFEFQVYDALMNLIDRFPLSLTTAPSGLGFRQEVKLVETKLIDYIVDRQMKKADIKLQAHFPEPNSYLKIRAFRVWYGKHIKSKTVLYYRNDNEEKWIDCIIKEFGSTEVDTRINTIPLTIQALSPFYQLRQKQIMAAITVSGKNYAYDYPYSYGGGVLENATFENTFFEDIPLRIRVHGKVVNPQVSLKYEDEVDAYTIVRFTDLTINEGQILEIDAINSRILLYASAEDTNPTDVYDQVDKTKDTFIYVKPGVNTLVANLDQVNITASVQITYVQYQV